MEVYLATWKAHPTSEGLLIGGIIHHKEIRLHQFNEKFEENKEWKVVDEYNIQRIFKNLPEVFLDDLCVNSIWKEYLTS